MRIKRWRVQSRKSLDDIALAVDKIVERMQGGRLYTLVQAQASRLAILDAQNVLLPWYRP